jgi:hypothetical protein
VMRAGASPHRGARRGRGGPDLRACSGAGTAIQRGTVIKADMAVFDLGPTGSRWPSPPTQARRGGAGRRGRALPGAHRAQPRALTARVMAGSRVPLRPRVRNTGEQALLVPPGRPAGPIGSWARLARPSLPSPPGAGLVPASPSPLGERVG